MKKRRQHHVWKSYLRAWAKDEMIFCLQDGKIFESNISGVGVERDFYKLQPLNKKDIEYIRLFIGKSPKSSSRVHENFITMFSISWMKDNIPAHLASDADFVRIIEEQIINGEEDFHSSVESGVMPILEAIRRRDISFYDDVKQCGRFLHFLNLQLFRSKGVKERIAERVTALPDFDIIKCWNVLRHIFAVNAGGSFLLERKQRPLFLIENDTGLPFITGDQPVINLFHSAVPTEAPDLVAFYYPVTPWLAIIIDEIEERCGYGTMPLSVEQVLHLNRVVYEASFSQVYGHSKEILSTLQA